MIVDISTFIPCLMWESKLYTNRFNYTKRKAYHSSEHHSKDNITDKTYNSYSIC